MMSRRRARPYPRGGPPPYGPPPGYGYGPPPAYGYDPPARPPAPRLPLAPMLRRAGARLLDNGLVAVFGFALILPVAVGALGLDTAGSETKEEGGIWTWPIILVLFVILSVLPFLYEAVQLTLWGQTLGKRWLGLRVVKVNPPGRSPGFFVGTWRAAVNQIGYQLGFFFFLILTVKVSDLAGYGLLLVSLGILLAYLRGVWDQPLRQSLHDKYAGTVVVDDRAGWE
jgi:uncharacterized RDD family membrane protein YckC